MRRPMGNWNDPSREKITRTDDISGSESRDANISGWESRPEIDYNSRIGDPIMIHLPTSIGLSLHINQFGNLPVVPNNARMDSKEDIDDAQIIMRFSTSGQLSMSSTA